MGADALGPPRSMAMVWLESAPARLVTTVDVVGEVVSPSKTTTPEEVPDSSGANTITRCPAVTRSPGFRISRALSGMLLTKVPFLLPRSCTVQSSPSSSNAKCWRERPASSGKHSSAALERPIDRRAPVSGMFFFCPSGHWTTSSRDMIRSSALSIHYRRREEWFLDWMPTTCGDLPHQHRKAAEHDRAAVRRYIAHARLRHFHGQHGERSERDHVRRSHAHRHVRHTRRRQTPDQHRDRAGRQNRPPYVRHQYRHHGADVHVGDSGGRLTHKSPLTPGLPDLDPVRDFHSLRHDTLKLLRCTLGFLATAAKITAPDTAL